MKGVPKKILCLTVLWFLFLTSQSVLGGTREFYNNLEYLFDNYGNDPIHWPECEQKMGVQSYIWLNFEKPLNECIFGRNFLGYGVFHSPEDARYDQLEGSEDAWGKSYDRIVASSPDGNKFLDVIRSVGNNLQVNLYNRELEDRLFIFLQADLHSQFADVFRNFNGKEFRIVARNINIMGAPGSAYSNYLDDISPALASAYCTEATIWVGKNDTITKLPSKVKTPQDKGLLGLKFGFRFGPGGQKAAKIVLKDIDADHPIKSYHKGIQEEMRRPIYVITTSQGFRTLTEESLLAAKFSIVGDWQKTSEIGGWVLVGREGRPDSERVAILVTRPNDSPAKVASQIRERNDREHLGKKAIVLLDGNPNSERNKALAEALRNEGYEDEDVLVVWRGDLYTTNGKLVAHGKYFLPNGAANDPVLAQGIWGHILRDFTGRPVYGDPLAGSKAMISLGGVSIDPKPSKAGKGGSETKKKVLKSRPSEDSLSWPVQIPGKED